MQFTAREGPRPANLGEREKRNGSPQRFCLASLSLSLPLAIRHSLSRVAKVRSLLQLVTVKSWLWEKRRRTLRFVEEEEEDKERTCEPEEREKLKGGGRKKQRGTRTTTLTFSLLPSSLSLPPPPPCSHPALSVSLRLVSSPPLRRACPGHLSLCSPAA